MASFQWKNHGIVYGVNSVGDISYDKNGNILTLTRSFIGEEEESIIMDKLHYVYDGNKLIAVDDDIIGSNSLNDFIDNGLKYDGLYEEYLYDLNGNMTQDLNRNINIEYNHLNLPKYIYTDQGYIKYDYDANGNKTERSIFNQNHVLLEKYRYFGDIMLDNFGIDQIATPEGSLKALLYGQFEYNYYLKDHLGNTRVIVRPETNTTPEIIQKNEYFPYGMVVSNNFGVNNKLYNGKELQTEMEHSFYDYGARFYDPQLGRWHVVDPIAEKYSSITPYCYTLNNPIIFIDPDGFYVRVSFTDKTHQAAIRNFLSTVEGRAFIGRYMKANTELFGYRFSATGDRSNDILELRSADMLYQKNPGLDRRIGLNETLTKNGVFDAHTVQSEEEVLGGFRQRITLDIGLDEIEATMTLGHEAFVHADKDADNLNNINDKIQTGGYKNFDEIIEDIRSIIEETGSRDHKDLKEGKVEKYKKFANELSKSKNNNEYIQNYEKDKNNPENN